MNVQTLVITEKGGLVAQRIMPATYRSFILGYKITKIIQGYSLNLVEEAKSLGATFPVNKFTALIYVVEGKEEIHDIYDHELPEMNFDLEELERAPIERRPVPKTILKPDHSVEDISTFDTPALDIAGRPLFDIEEEEDFLPELPKDPRITGATFAFDKRRLQMVVEAKWDNLTTGEVLSYYPDELSFCESELIGLTQEEVNNLFRKKDMAYIQS